MGDAGDGQRAAVAAQVARLAAERDVQNEWSKPTLLTLAFFDRDVPRTQAYAKEIRRAGPAAWRPDTTIKTLERSVRQTADGGSRMALEAILGQLKSLLVQTGTIGVTRDASGRAPSTRRRLRIVARAPDKVSA